MANDEYTIPDGAMAPTAPRLRLVAYPAGDIRADNLAPWNRSNEPLFYHVVDSGRAGPYTKEYIEDLAANTGYDLVWVENEDAAKAEEEADAYWWDDENAGHERFFYVKAENDEYLFASLYNPEVLLTPLEVDFRLNLARGFISLHSTRRDAEEWDGKVS